MESVATVTNFIEAGFTAVKPGKDYTTHSLTHPTHKH